jgi:beta-hydroxylase
LIKTNSLAGTSENSKLDPLRAAWADGVTRVRRLLDYGKKPARILDALNSVLLRAENDGAFRRVDDFWLDYHDEYAGLRELERHHDEVKAECVELLRQRSAIPDIESLGGAYTSGGIHAIKWKAFFLKAGPFIEENCLLAPRTAQRLRAIPQLHVAFFSVLEPHQRIPPHWGYWKGFLRYHLGVVIPDTRACWMRINRESSFGHNNDTTLIERGKKHHWTEGRGVIFDDTFLHDAANESDDVRVVLWLDLRRKLPAHLDYLNRFVLTVGNHEPSVVGIRRKAIVKLV